MRVAEKNLNELKLNVEHALAEDIGTGDITAQLIPTDTHARAHVITRDQAVICGQQWVDEVFAQVDPSIRVEWHCNDGEQVPPGHELFTAHGCARSLLTAERAALNFLQLLSGTATLARDYADAVAGTDVKILDTRKTVPGLRMAQKYAVTCGGCHNHRIGLFDAFLIKENHINACGSINTAVSEARAAHGDKPIEVEVENMKELEQALAANADIIMLDNFTIAQTKKAVALAAGRAKLEASGGITRKKLRVYAQTGVDYISIGALTKDVIAIDLSMRVETI
ncbi:MAG: carboxylating nicotinate-nucleotide diphosphorylase [Pseudomonadales bacterium]